MLGSSWRSGTPRRLSTADLDQAVEGRAASFEAMRGSKVFLTGGTGFIGRWLLESLLRENARFGLGVSVVLLTRDPREFARHAPQLAGSGAVRLLAGDVRSFEFPAGRFDRVIHLAGETNTLLTNPDPDVYFDVILGGMRHVLDFAEQSRSHSLLFVSSGAVYGRQPAEVERLREDDPYGPQPVATGNAYGEAKRCSEMLAYARGERTGLKVTVARGFAFVGPYLPLDSGYAVGNFIRDALAGREIVVQGDGFPRRTYMYAADMARWLWSIALEGSPGRPYNVGSDEVVTIGELAQLVAASAGGLPVRILGESGRSGIGTAYIPDIARARSELGLTVDVRLQEAVRRTIDWHRGAPNQSHGGGL